MTRPRTIDDYSALGYGAVTGQAAAEPRVGFTMPTDIYEKMRQIDLDAAILNRDVLENVDPRASYAAGWKAWFDNWRAFFDANYQKFRTLLHTDALDRAVEDKRTEFRSFHADYARQKTRAGQPVPQTNAPDPVRTPEGGTDGAKSGFRLPWWFWVGGTVALAGLGYYGYTKAKELKAKREALEKYVLPGLIGGPLAKAASARDPSVGLFALGGDPKHVHAYHAFQQLPPMPRAPAPQTRHLLPASSLESRMPRFARDFDDDLDGGDY